MTRIKGLDFLSMSNLINTHTHKHHTTKMGTGTRVETGGENGIDIGEGGMELREVGNPPYHDEERVGDVREGVAPTRAINTTCLGTSCPSELVMS